MLNIAFKQSVQMKKLLLPTLITLLALVTACNKSDSDSNTPSANILLLRDGYVPDGYIWHFSDTEISANDFTTLVAALAMRATSNDECVYLEMPNIKSIPDSAFEGSKSYFVLEAPTATSVGNSAFKGTKINALLSMEQTSDSAYTFALEATKANEDIAIALVNMSSLKTIGDYAFSECDNLVAVDTPAIEIGDYAFANNRELEHLTLSQVESLGELAFEDCQQLGGNTSIETETLDNYTLNLITAQYIGSRAFDDTKIESVIVGSLSAISGDSFAGSYISSIYISSTEGTLANGEDGVIYDGDSLRSILAENTPDDGIVTLDSQIATIGDSACAYCTNLEQLIAPSVTTIESDAFAECNNLESLTLATTAGVKLISIDSSAFSGCDTESISLTLGSDSSSLVQGNTLTIGGVSYQFMSIAIQ